MLKDNSAQGYVEYVILVTVALLASAAVLQLGNAVNTRFEEAADGINNLELN